MSWLVLVAVAFGADTWTTPHPGVSLLERTASGPRRIVVAEVDLCAPGLSVRATAQDERQRTTSSFASLVGADLAVNADFFSYAGYLPVGMAIGDGAPWRPDNSGSGFVAFGDDAAVLANAGTWNPPDDWMREAVGGFPLVVDGAVAADLRPSHCANLEPRTAVGLSKDRRKLLLAVVDGRSTASVGMTCAQLAALLIERGAHEALNLDGGGSSTLWSRGRGVVNDPSDGAERVVANHLAILADGSGPPASCDWTYAEPLDDAGAWDDAPVDVDGDGRADVCARGAAGVSCRPSTGTGFASGWTLPDTSDAAGWGHPARYGTLRFGDLDGDGRSDLCGRHGDGVRCWRSTGSGWSDPIVGPALTDGAGWSDPAYASTLRLADVTGDGRDDLCARAAAGVRCYPSTGTGFGAPFQTARFADASGWNDPARYGTLRFGDVDGDGRADVCGRTGSGVWCALSDGSGFPGTVQGPAWTDAAGWDEVRHWSSFRLVDLDGDGRADLCGRGAAGVVCHRSLGTSFGPAIAGPPLSDATGWGDHANHATLRFGDVDGDGDLDACARADAGFRCWPFTGAGFGAAVVGPAWTAAGGWEEASHYATIRLGDLDGDGKADVCGRGRDGVECWRSDGAGFPTRVAGPAWADSVGWAAPKYYATLRFGSPSRPEPPDTGTDTGPPDTGTDPPDTGDTADTADTGAPGETGLVDTQPFDTTVPPDTGSPDTGAPPVAPGGCSCAAPGGPPPGLAALLAAWLAGRIVTARRLTPLRGRV